MKEYLDSNRVNFLIWRYLIEGNYRETAVKFQKEWHIEEPHRELDFARHVKSHALVNVLNKGLLYNSLERDFAQSQRLSQENAAAVAEALQLGVFGPLLAQPARQDRVEEAEHDADEDAEGEVETVEEIENSRKRQNDRPQALVNGGSPAKRPRLSNGYENGVDAATDPMEVDGQHGGDNHAYPSPLEGEQAPTPVPRTDGPEQGTQVEKVEELTTETIFIPLGPEENPIGSEASAVVSRISNSNDNAPPVLLHCQWNPRDPTMLAAGGTDALARIWSISRAMTTDHAQTQDPAANHVNGIVPPFHTLIEDGVGPKSTVTAMAWNWDGTAIAIATDSETKGRISLWSKDGTHIHHFEVPESPIIKLRWSPNNAAILAIAPDHEGTLVAVYHAMTANSMSYVLSDYNIDADLDAAWINDSDFLLCGGQLLMSMKCDGGSIVEINRFETRAGDTLSKVHFDWRSTLAATCGEKGFVDIWDAGGNHREIKAHDGVVTALAWQPLQNAPSDDERLLASAGEDGAIFIWNAKSPDGKPKCSMTMNDPIVALSFTPDGAFIAGATHERILIWKVGDHSIPRASWNRKPHSGWQSPRLNSESEDEDEHCLCWDSTGQKLAYGVNSRLAIINFR
ncbi:WD40-repeat-containing domain protein [Xylariales sp. PMI_506]|nr:WD40-repeat-containing domain protein [Xylariales sp. PMI_506]